MKHIDDFCERKHGGNEQSVDANNKNKLHRETQRLAVLELIKDSPNGMTMKEVARAMDVPLHTISGRASQLKQYGLVEPTGEVRDGSAVLQATSRVFAPIVVTKLQPPPEPKETITPLSPAQAQREFKSLEDMYEHTNMSSDDYDKAKSRIYKGLGLWGDAL